MNAEPWGPKGREGGGVFLRLRSIAALLYESAYKSNVQPELAPVESCQSLPAEVAPWGRLGSVLYTCKRLRRMRRRFKHFWPISLSSPPSPTIA